MELFVEPSCSQPVSAPDSFHIPKPRMASTLNQPSPVPKYMFCGSDGSWAILVMARLPKKSSIFDHVQPVLKSVVCHNPPPTPAAQTVFPVGSFASIKMALVLPPMLFGPLSVQDSEVISFASSALFAIEANSISSIFF